MSTLQGTQMEMDGEAKLLVPTNDIADPEISIVVPALNEQLTIGQFVAWCKEGLEKAGVKGEILIVDSSKDETAEIAVAAGARVLSVPKRGLGRAYIDSVPYIRGRYIIMGDCDCTYDFRELKPFAEHFRSGSEYIMGSRFKGYIEDGAMPGLHRYFGTPFTTWILNFMYRSKFTDIHCGMRGISLEGFKRMQLQSQGWEYASEMVLKSVRMQLKTSEVPIRFYKDQQGRLSHHKRSGWLSPWIAGWVNLRAMFVYGADIFLFRPGQALLAAGLLLTLPLAFGPISVGPITFSLYWSLLGLSLAILGLQCVYMGILARIMMDFSGTTTQKWLSKFRYDRSVLASFGACMAGVLAGLPLVLEYLRDGLRLSHPSPSSLHLAVIGLLLMVGGFMSFTFTLVLHALALSRDLHRS